MNSLPTIITIKFFSHYWRERVIANYLVDSIMGKIKLLLENDSKYQEHVEFISKLLTHYSNLNSINSESSFKDLVQLISKKIDSNEKEWKIAIFLTIFLIRIFDTFDKHVSKAHREDLNKYIEEFERNFVESMILQLYDNCDLNLSNFVNLDFFKRFISFEDKDGEEEYKYIFTEILLDKNIDINLNPVIPLFSYFIFGQNEIREIKLDNIKKILEITLSCKTNLFDKIILQEGTKTVQEFNRHDFLSLLDNKLRELVDLKEDTHVLLNEYNRYINDAIMQYFNSKTIEILDKIIEEKRYINIRDILEPLIKLLFVSETLLYILYLKKKTIQKNDKEYLFNKIITLEGINVIYLVFIFYVFALYVTLHICNKKDEKKILLSQKSLTKILTSKRSLRKFIFIRFLIEAFRDDCSITKKRITDKFYEALVESYDKDSYLNDDFFDQSIASIYEIFSNISINMLLSEIIFILRSRDIFGEMRSEMREKILHAYLRLLAYGLINLNIENVEHSLAKHADKNFCRGIKIIASLLNSLIIFTNLSDNDRLLIARLAEKLVSFKCDDPELKLITNNLRDRIKLL